MKVVIALAAILQETPVMATIARLLVLLTMRPSALARTRIEDVRLMTRKGLEYGR